MTRGGRYAAQYGAGNQVGAKNPTNAVRLFGMLEADDPTRQLLYYDPSVGTILSAQTRGPVDRRLSQLSGRAFGTALRSNLAGAYAYLMEHWEPSNAQILWIGSAGHTFPSDRSTGIE
ncbi:phospholipase effector Tle1 domain-containing protein [Streptomyces sp. NPDC056512]|uniref:phospholipase effector Tle1 domain-containing protein n=1 Tax=Streptomyces sp. NPDC056512 TaxID=3345846 RepID=UPI0036CD4A6E